MTENQYIEVCKLTDEILQSKSASSTRVAIPWLHVLHLHLHKYEDIYDNNIITKYKISKQKLLNIASLILLLSKALFHSHYSKWLKSIGNQLKIDTLFVSHLLNKSQYYQENDFYFSDLPQKISDAGFKSLVVAINHTDVVDFHDTNINSKNLKKLVLPSNLGFFDEMKNLGLLWAEYKTLKKEAKFEKNKIKKKFLYFAAIDSLSSGSLTSLRLVTQIGLIIKILEPKSLITTHEGLAWERKIYETARQINPNIKCIAYTHAPIFKNQHAVKRNLAKQFNPDIILVSGNTQKQQLEKCQLLKDIQINILGTVRCLSKRINNTDLKIKNKTIYQQSCLVAPLGMKAEIDLLFDFSLECAKALPDCIFIWRLHPLFKFNKLKYSNLPNNIRLSDRTLESDLEESQWVLYRASSVVIQAVVVGLKPIYLYQDDKVNIDPIYEIKSWKSKVTSIYDFESTIKQKKGSYSDYQYALNYCLNLYSPLNEEILIKAIR